MIGIRRRPGDCQSLWSKDEIKQAQITRMLLMKCMASGFVVVSKAACRNQEQSLTPSLLDRVQAVSRNEDSQDFLEVLTSTGMMTGSTSVLPQ
jgi:hypothetical protein